MEYEREESIGYITGEQAALQFFQKGVTAAFSIGFDGLMDGVVGSFKGFGILAEGLENLGKSIIKNNFNSWVNAFELDGKGGWDWNGEAYQESAWGSGALGMYASAFVTPMAQRGATDFFTQDGTGLDLTGNVFGIKNLAALGNTIGGLTGEFASYLFDGDFSVNVLNMSDFTGGAVNQGLFELSLTGKSRLGGGGANVGGLTGILNSLEAIKTDALYVASRKLGGNQGLAEINATNRLGYAGEADLAKRLVSGDLKIQWSDLDDAHGKFLQGQEGTIHISTAYANNDAESASKMAAVIGHEATHEQGERVEAYAHLSGSSIYRTLMQRGMATDSDFLNGIMNELLREENYLENSGDTDWWKLIVQRDEAGEIIGGRLEDDGKEAFTIIDGEAISIGALQEATGNNWFRFRSLAEALDTTETGLLQGLLFENMTIGGIDFSKENTGFEMSLNQAITQFLMQKANGESNRAAYFIPGQSAFTERSWEEFGRQVVSVDIPVKSATNSGGNLPPETSRFDLRPSGRFGQGLALVFRNESPFSWIFSELENRRSQIASATVGSPKTSCQVVNGRWETTIVDACPQRSSRISSRLMRSTESIFDSPKSSRMMRSLRAITLRSRS
jgi:hypothetical protein